MMPLAGYEVNGMERRNGGGGDKGEVRGRKRMEKQTGRKEKK